MEPFQSANVEAVFEDYPSAVKPSLLRLRQLIFDTAASIQGVGPLEETLKWGQPSYLTLESGSGTTIRIDQIKSEPGQIGLFVHCQTTLIPSYREMYGDCLKFDGNRGLRIEAGDEPSAEVIGHCIALALTYHSRKKSRSRSEDASK